MKTKKPEKRVRLRSIRALKLDLDAAFSKYIRQRGMTDQGCNTCVSCGAVHDWKVLQAGHFYRRQHLGTRWDARNAWPQCFACNVWRRGNYASYAKFMYSKHSQSVMDELDQLHRQSLKLTREHLEELIDRYREKDEALV